MCYALESQSRKRKRFCIAPTLWFLSSFPLHSVSLPALRPSYIARQRNELVRVNVGKLPRAFKTSQIKVFDL